MGFALMQIQLCFGAQDSHTDLKCSVESSLREYCNIQELDKKIAFKYSVIKKFPCIVFIANDDLYVNISEGGKSYFMISAREYIEKKDEGKSIPLFLVETKVE